VSSVTIYSHAMNTLFSRAHATNILDFLVCFFYESLLVEVP
jgi:hypothetical protein